MAVAQFLGVEKNLALPDDAVWTTCEAGGKRGKREAGRLKAKGVKPGWPDILVVYRGRLICIELKSEKGRLSKSQKAMHDRLMRAGAVVITAWHIEQVEDFLRDIMPLRASTGTRAA